MAFSRRSKEPVPEVDTNIWACKNENCSGWMRASFSFNEDPNCPLCQSSMQMETHVLPEVGE
ncbi:hypothetical protein GCM10028778_06320 [Barrientosiimonas marina]|uniref:Cold-shock protein n=1 Tax=Lentibacillus kimchii TaxID=1542911 RepID=A0ABW2UV55_9BACI